MEKEREPPAGQPLCFTAIPSTELFFTWLISSRAAHHPAAGEAMLPGIAKSDGFMTPRHPRPQTQPNINQAFSGVALALCLL